MPLWGLHGTAVLVWINGPFGVGKTHVVAELARRVPTAFVADPELLGYAIHRMLPPAARHDYQDRPQWRAGVVATLIDAVHEHSGPVLVPMTITNPGYFDEIMGGLSSGSVDAHHLSLMASPATIRRRIRRRAGYGLDTVLARPDVWALDRVEPCLRALGSDRFAWHVDTETRTLDEVVEHAAAHLSLTLVEPRLGRVRREVHRLATTLRHVRW